MFENFKKNPVLLVILLALCIIIIVAVFTPRGGKNHLSAGLKFGGHVGSLRGNFNIETFESSTPSLVLYYAPWCGHCKKLMPEFQQFQQSYDGPVTIKAVDCDANKELAQKHNIQGFPTIRYYAHGTNQPNEYVEYSGPRNATGLHEFMNKVSGVVAKAPDNAAPVQ